jgi:ABC-type Fe3+-siderophore transport system permease subunit
MTASSETISKAEKAKTKRAQITAHYNKATKKKIFFIFFLFILVIIASGIAATIGPYQISFTEVYSILFHCLFYNVETYEQYAIWDLRLPRILLAIFAGAGLAVAGTMMQGILKNPLAEPYTMGIASGAGFGAALVIRSIGSCRYLNVIYLQCVDDADRSPGKSRCGKSSAVLGNRLS